MKWFPMLKSLRFQLTVLVLILLLAGSCRKADTAYIAEIMAYQEEQNAHFRDTIGSPLPKDVIASFGGLEFFPVDEKYRVEAEFTVTPETEPFLMPTTTTRVVTYKKYGEASFRLNGKKMTLALYQNQDLRNRPGYQDYLFLPFKDLTNGHESYGGGRYLDLSIPPGEEIIIDFNKSYNPYCAYNPRYSCPIPPDENHLDIEIRAGVKAYEH